MTKSLSCDVVWPGTSPFPITHGVVGRSTTEPRRRTTRRRCLGISGYPYERAVDNLDVSRCGSDPRSGGLSPNDGTSTAAGCPAAVAVAALIESFAMPYHDSERRGSTFLPVSIRVAIAGVMVGSQGLDERVMKSRQIMV